MRKYEINGRYSSHFMRKTLGRRIWNQNNCSEKALLLLGQVFNHSNIQTTKIYLGNQRRRNTKHIPKLMRTETINESKTKVIDIENQLSLYLEQFGIPFPKTYFYDSQELIPKVEIKEIDVEFAAKHLPKNYLFKCFKGLISRRIDEDDVQDYDLKQEIANSLPRFRQGYYLRYTYYIEKTEQKWLEDLIDRGLYREDGSKYSISDFESLQGKYGIGFRSGYYALDQFLAEEPHKTAKEEIVISEIMQGHHHRIPIANDEGKVIFYNELLSAYENQGYRYALKYRAWVYILDHIKSFEKYDDWEKASTISRKINPSN